MSWVIRLLGGTITVGSVPAYVIIFGNPDNEHSLWTGMIEPTVFVVLALGFIVYYAGAVAGRRARRHLARVITSPAEFSPRSYVLYLRPFLQDQQASGFGLPSARGLFDVAIAPSVRTHEEQLAKMFRRFGPMVTVGKPGEELPAGSGACRFYLPHSEWQSPVRELIEGARVILLGAGPGEGTIWEYAEVMRRAQHHRLVVLVTDPQWYAQFKTRATAALEAELPELMRRYGCQWQPPVLPSLPPRRSRFYVKAMIYFGPGGQASLSVFDRPDWRNNIGLNGYLRKRLSPVLAHLKTAVVMGSAPVAQATPRPTSGLHAGVTTFTNMTSRVLTVIRQAWMLALVGCFVSGLAAIGYIDIADVGNNLASQGALAVDALAFGFGGLGTLVAMATYRVPLARWRTLALSSSGFTVSVATLRYSQVRVDEVRWEQVVNIEVSGHPGKHSLSAWIKDGGYSPPRPVWLCPLRAPDFPIDAVQDAIAKYCPTVTIKSPRD